ncbi:MAG: periplasmic heavy metal sensor [Desulfatiglandaceae bacterium]
MSSTIGGTLRKISRITRIIAVPALFCFILSFSSPGVVSGEPPRHRWKAEGEDSCLTLDELYLDDKQKAAVMEISGPCRDQLLRIRAELIGKHMELRRMLRDPAVTEEVIEETWKEADNLNASMRRELKRYTLGIRRILTPEQIKDWCALVEIHPRRGRR